MCSTVVVVVVGALVPFVVVVVLCCWAFVFVYVRKLQSSFLSKENITIR